MVRSIDSARGRKLVVKADDNPESPGSLPTSLAGGDCNNACHEATSLASRARHAGPPAWPGGFPTPPARRLRRWPAEPRPATRWHRAPPQESAPSPPVVLDLTTLPAESKSVPAAATAPRPSARA